MKDEVTRATLIRSFHRKCPPLAVNDQFSNYCGIYVVTPIYAKYVIVSIF
jgi:hypothetical protein